jgi:hypothetical protein
MNPFHTVAVPHKDVLEGDLSLETFAADLWETHMGRSPEEYRDAETFFSKTYMTAGLKDLLEKVEKRLSGGGGDPYIQLRTPFGGGKTHTLIALYHRARQSKIKTAVLVGTALGNTDTLWGEIEKQLAGKVSRLTGNIAPGTEKLRSVLEPHAPVLILIDELLEYVTKAAGIQVGESNLAAQTEAFMQELSQVASSVKNVCVVVTLPSSSLEHFDAAAEKFYNQLQKVSGRVEKVIPPVQDSEVVKVIRKRLFASVDEEKAKKVVQNFIRYAEDEGLIPAGKKASEYRDSFVESYPFLPEVVDIMYHRWGSFPTFQRTRGVLRILGLVVNSLKESSSPYISLADFDLSNQKIRGELVKYIGNEYDSVVASDITSDSSGAKRVDRSMSGSLKGLKIGSRTATAIFMCSFSGGFERGMALADIKRLGTTLQNQASAVADAIEQLRSTLFFLQSQDGRLLFSNNPNLNRILLTFMENVTDEELVQAERDLLEEKCGNLLWMRVYLWPEKSKDIPDNEEIKLVVMRQTDEGTMKEFIVSKGESPRVHRNTVIFLTPSTKEESSFRDYLRRAMAYKKISSDTTLRLTVEQNKEIHEKLGRIKKTELVELRKYYRQLFVPVKEGVKAIDIGMPTVGEEKKLSQECYDELKERGEILERISPKILKQVYMGSRDYVLIQQILDAMTKTPGERRYAEQDVIIKSVREGVATGEFGVGKVEDGQPRCLYFKQEASSLDPSDVIMADKLCTIGAEKEREETKIPPIVQPSEVIPSKVSEESMPNVYLEFNLPLGKAGDIARMMNMLQKKFKILRVTIKAEEGSIGKSEFDNTVKETLRQLGIEER